MNDKNILRDLVKANIDNKKWFQNYIYGNYPRVRGDVDFVKNNIKKDSKVLDIGGVPPIFASLLKSHGFSDITVFDPNPEPFSAYFEENDIKYVKINLLKDSLIDYRNCFDFVSINEVLEHMTGDLLTTIQNITDCVKPGGKLLVTTPNLRSIWGLSALIFANSGLASKPTDSVRDQYERAGTKYGYYGHVREYTPKEVTKLFESFRFKLVRKRFQKHYGRPKKITRKLIFKVIVFIEFLFPNWRLFGKYLFQKNKY